MRCETCHGSGKVLSPLVPNTPPAMRIKVPCPTCNGSGVDYCCGPSAVPDMALCRKESLDE